MESARQISEIVQEIINQTSDVVSTAIIAEQAVTSQTETVSETAECSDNVNSTVEKQVSAITNLDVSAKQLYEKADFLIEILSSFNLKD